MLLCCAPASSDCACCDKQASSSAAEIVAAALFACLPCPPPPRFLAVGGYDNTVRMLSLEDGTQLRPVATQAVNVSGGLSWTHQQRLSRSSCAACGSSSKQPWR